MMESDMVCDGVMCDGEWPICDVIVDAIDG